MGELVSGLKEQAKAILVMMGVAILSVISMIVLDYFTIIVRGIPGLGIYNLSDATVTLNETVQATLTLFITAFGLTGSFASVTVLIIVIKGIISAVRNMKS